MAFTSRLSLLAIAPATLSLACGGGGDNPGDRGYFDDAVDADAAGDQAPADTVADLQDPARDTAGPDIPVDIPQGSFGFPCDSNDDCDSGFCVEGEQGYLCTEPCLEECPEGWVCRAINVGPDMVSLCVQVGVNLCKPCKLDSQCGGGLCLDLGSGWFCGRDCQESTCPDGYECTDVVAVSGLGGRQCVPVSGACDCTPKQAGMERPCVVENEYGRCLGFETCDPQKGWIGCDAVQPGPEECDGVDNDCNGVADDSPVKPGENCVNEVEGVGSCTGQWVCNGKDGWTCVGPTPEIETCNHADDDCDGLTDEDFLVDGMYLADTACGNCYADCTGIWDPEVFHAVGHCVLVDDTPRCRFECEQGYVDADTNPDNGCELFLDPDAIFVSTPQNGGTHDEACGTWDLPCDDIGFGIQRAVESGRSKVLVSEGLYAGNLVLADGVSVLGGYNAVTWERDPDTNVSILQGSSLDTGTVHTRTVEADGITKPTELSGFTIFGENNFSHAQDGRGGNSYAVWARDCSSALVIRDNLVYAGRGAPGADGTPGSDGAAGGHGYDGAHARETSKNCSQETVQGGNGGASACGSSGGEGADARCPVYEFGFFPFPDVPGQADAGSPGDGPEGAGTGGTGGDGGFDRGVDTSNCATVYTAGSHSAEGGSGLPGEPGTSGKGGEGCDDAEGLVSDGEWLGLPGAAGLAGTAGEGGGGGGAGGGVNVEGPGTCDAGDTLAGAGAGGGAGGCPGEGGTGGSAGGGSFGIFVITTQDGPDTLPVVEDNVIVRNQGGKGGDGGAGGFGGVGGAGGTGGGIDGLVYSFAIGSGGDGGDGGDGGHGGGGGGGCGGPSYGLFVAGWTDGGTDPCSSESGNTFSAVGGGGAGGNGGYSAGLPGSDGTPGEAADCKSLTSNQ